MFAQMISSLHIETPREKLLRLSGSNQDAIPRMDIEQALWINRLRLDQVLKGIPSSEYTYKDRKKGWKHLRDISFTEKGIDAICTAAQQLEITNTQVKTVLKKPILKETGHTFSALKDLHGITTRDWIEILGTHAELFTRLSASQTRSTYYILDENVSHFLEELQKIRSKRK